MPDLMGFVHKIIDSFIHTTYAAILHKTKKLAVNPTHFLQTVTESVAPPFNYKPPTNHTNPLIRRSTARSVGF